MPRRLLLVLLATVTSGGLAPGTVHVLRDVGDDDSTMAEPADHPYSTAIEASLGSCAASFVAPPAPAPVPAPA